MSSSDHTPGPWTAAWANDVGPDDDYYVEFYEILDDKGNRVGTAEEKADAVLMALAPMLQRANQLWDEKTQWVQDTAVPFELGMHRADVLKQRIDNLKALCEEMLAELYVYRASEHLKDVTAALKAKRGELK